MVIVHLPVVTPFSVTLVCLKEFPVQMYFKNLVTATIEKRARAPAGWRNAEKVVSSYKCMLYGKDSG